MDSTTIGRLMTAAELARGLNVKPSWVYAKVASGEIPHVYVGCYPRFVPEEVIEWLRSGRGRR